MLDFPKNGKVTVNNGNRTIRFGAFEADLPSGEIRKSGSRIKLQDQPFKVLQILLEHPGDLVTREELQSRIWPEDSFGDFDHAVNVAVGKLRAALGDSAENPSFIETVPRRGYRFVATLDESPVDTHPQLPASYGDRPSRVVSKRTLLALFAIGISGILVASGVFLGRRTTQWQPPDFQRLTVSRGTVFAARFAPDGRSVIYAASWNGEPTEIFSTDPKIPGARSLGFPSTQLLAVSSSGEMAVLQSVDYRFLFARRGTLGQVPLTGGSPRQLAEDIYWADWSTDGTTLAVVRNVSGKQRLEFPLGHILYETAGWISHPRISPKGDQVAFLDHPIYPDDKGVVAIVDLAGHKRVVSTAWESVEGLAWSADGTEIWFSAAQAGPERHIYAVDLSCRQRLIFRAPGGITLQDIASDGRVLVTRDEQRVGMMALAPSNKEDKEKEISWRDWSVPTDISSDGNTVLFDEQGVESGSTYTVAVRDTRGSPPIPLGQGMAGRLSPDGKWASTIVSNAHLLLLPIGAGTAQQIDQSDIQQYWHGANWMPDGKQIVFSGNRPGHAVQCFAQDIEGGKPRPVTPEGVTFCEISPDGKWIVGNGLTGGGDWLYPMEGGQPRPIPGLQPGESFSWTSDPRWLYVYQWKQSPVEIYRLNILNGQRQFFKEMTPPDPAGLHDISSIHFSSDGRAYVYRYTRLLSELYLVKGLK
ncbi:MAG: winged helix-turn-helix domain-containing protein [Terriglobales bacterium]|jgi:eukaryotic-like serine/threonine-protein kinase